MEIDIVRDSEGLEALREEWTQLEEADPEVPFYSTFAVVRGWWSSYGAQDGVQLLVVTARQNGQLVGVAPLSYRPQRRYGVPINEVRFASHGDYLAFLLHPEQSAGTVTNALVDAVFEQPDWDILNLTNIPASTPFAAALLRSKHHASLVPLSENPYLDLTRHEDFASFAEAGLPSHTRKYRNKFLRETGATFRVVPGDEPGLLDRMGEVHRAERDHLRAQGRTERHSLFDDELRVGHYREIYARPGAAVAFVYEDEGGDLLAYRTCFVHRRTQLSWNSAYRPEVADYRLGKVIQYDILEHLYAEGGTDIFDFGAGRYPWKFEWTDLSSLSYRFRHDRPALTAAAPPTPMRAPAAAQVRADRVRANRVLTAEVEAARAERDRRRESPGRGAVALGRAAGVRAVRGALRRSRPPVIYYVPHPDDEAIYMGASIWSERSRRTIVVSLTSGASSNVLGWINERLGQDLSPEAFTRSRVADLRRSVAHLGVEAQDVDVRDLPDGKLTPELVGEVVAELERRHPGASHRTMSYLDPHPDHAAAGEAVRRAFEEGVITDCLFHLPVDLMKEDPGQPVRLSTAAEDAKRAALAEYRVWDPFADRYAVGLLSVPDLIASQTIEPRESVHGPSLRRAEGGGRD